MKKFKVLPFVTGVVTLAALFVGTASVKADTTLTVGASANPHALILKHVQKELKKEGVNLKVKVYNDYVLPNKALANGDIDANYFQHVPFLDNWNKHNNGSLVNVGTIHLEPIAVYSKDYKSLKDLPKGAKVDVSSNTADYGRILKIFKDAGLITLKKGTNLTSANFDDIKTNKKNLKFVHTYEAKLMPTLYKKNDAAATVINANYAVQAGLNPKTDSIAIEKNSSPYGNIIAVQKKDKNNKDIKKLVKVLKSKSTQNWIQKHFKGAVLPVK